MKFRTKYAQGSYTDYEHYEPGTSLTEPGQAESMEHLMQRLTRFPVSTIDTSLSAEEAEALYKDAEFDELASEGKTGIAEAMDVINAELVASRSEAVADESKEQLIEQQATNSKNATAEQSAGESTGEAE